MQITQSNFEQFKNKILYSESYPKYKFKFVKILDHPSNTNEEFTVETKVYCNGSHTNVYLWLIMAIDNYEVFSDDTCFFENALTLKLSAGIKELSHGQSNEVSVDPNFKSECCEKQDVIKSAMDGKPWCRNCGWKEK